MKNQDPDAAVQAAEREIDPSLGEREVAQQMAHALSSIDPQPDIPPPEALVIGGRTYLRIPELGEYVDDDGEALDLRTKPARQALAAHRRSRIEAAALAAVQREREEKGPEDLHAVHVTDGEHLAAFHNGRRWLPVAQLHPGAEGGDGVQVGHGVVVEYRDESGERYQWAGVVSHVHTDGTVSVEAGSRLGAGYIAVHPKPHHLRWLELAAAVEGRTVDQYVARMIGQAYAVSDVRAQGTTAAGSPSAAMAGRAGAHSGVAADLEAGRKHTAAQKAASAS